MTLNRAGRHALAMCLLLPGMPAWAQENPYTYVKMSLTVPWTLYFVFLACVLIPFVLMIVLAWRNSAEKDEQEDQDR